MFFLFKVTILFVKTCLKTNQQSYSMMVEWFICDRSFKCKIFVSGKCLEYMQLPWFFGVVCSFWCEEFFETMILRFEKSKAPSTSCSFASFLRYNVLKICVKKRKNIQFCWYLQNQNQTTTARTVAM